MTKRYNIIHLPDGYMYGIDKEAYPIKDDTVFLHGLCKIEDELWRKGKYIGKIEYSNYPTYFDVKVNGDYRPIRQVTKIIFTNNPSLGLPLLPYIEENTYQLAKTEYNKPNNKTAQFASWSHGFAAGYKAASKKRYTEEDMVAIYHLGHQVGMNTEIAIVKQFDTNPPKMPDVENIRDKYIQSLSPKPIAVEIVVEELIRYEVGMFTGGIVSEEAGKITYKPKLIDNKVQVKQWIYE